MTDYRSKNYFVGFYRLDEPTVFRNQYETAAWYQDVLVQPGRYPVFWYPNWTYGGNLSVALPGMVASEWFGALWGGVAINPKAAAERAEANVGKPASHRLWTDARPDELGDQWELNPARVAVQRSTLFYKEVRRQYGWEVADSGERVDPWVGPRCHWFSTSRLVETKCLPAT